MTAMKRLIAVLALVGTLGPDGTAPAEWPATDVRRPRPTDAREARGASYYVALRSPGDCFHHAGPWQLHGPYDRDEVVIKKERLPQGRYETMVLLRAESRRPPFDGGVGEDGPPRRRPSVSRPRMRFE